MENFNTHTQVYRCGVFLKCLILFAMIMVNFKVHAQYNIKIDSLKFPAYYPPVCSNCNVDYSNVWYSNVDIRIITRGNIVTGSTDCPNNKCPTIILTPGGAFAEILEGGLIYNGGQSIYNSNDTVTLAVSLAKKGYTVIVPSYKVAEGGDNLEITSMILGCISSADVKAKLEYYQLTAFHDFRKTLRLFLSSPDSTTKYNIDSNKVVLAGFSAGGFLAINSLFLESNEMPTSIVGLPALPTLPFSSGYNYTVNTRNQHYPIPKLKGVIAFTAGTFYPQIMENNYNKNIPLYFLHGTCDNLISQDVGLVPYKCLPSLNLNSDNGTKYRTVYGSSWLFKKLLLNNYPVKYDQVCYGGHNTVPSIRGAINYEPVGDNSWDEYVACPKVGDPNFTTRKDYWLANKHKNFTDPIESRIVDFCNSVFVSPSTFVTKLSGFQSEGPENCSGDTTDIIPITNLTLSGQICYGNTVFPRFATLTGGKESVLYYWRFGGNINKVFTTQTPVIMLDTIPNSIELSNCSSVTDVCKTFTTCSRVINVTAVNGCDTITFSNTSSITACTGTCCTPCSIGARMSQPTEEDANKEFAKNNMTSLGDRQLSLEMSNDSKGVLQLFNMQGALVAKTHQNLLSGNNTILLDAEKLLPKGVYIAHYVDDEQGIILSTKIALQ